METIIFVYDLVACAALVFLGAGLINNRITVNGLAISRLHPASLLFSALGLATLYLTYEVAMALWNDGDPGLTLTLAEAGGGLCGLFISFVCFFATSVKWSGKEAYGNKRIAIQIFGFLFGVVISFIAYRAMLA